MCFSDLMSPPVKKQKQTKKPTPDDSTVTGESSISLWGFESILWVEAIF